MKKLVCLLIALMVFSGCATKGSISRNYAKVNPSDGIDRKEAVFIAQYKLFETDLKDSYLVNYPRVHSRIMKTSQFWGKEFDTWQVSFGYKQLELLFRNQPLDIFIDKNSGEVVGWVERGWMGLGAGEVLPNQMLKLGKYPMKPKGRE
ncbi:MAG: hypothetical protein JW734_00665 [Candidatus Omnitrophica bacterium]|nr:hypothetical protein [Candidatus Omnitrophota bacterium]